MSNADVPKMEPSEFRLLRDLIGYTQVDVADAGVAAGPRTVANWDAVHSPSPQATAWLLEQKELFASRLREALEAPMVTQTDENGEAVVLLKRYETDEALHADHPEYARVRHYDAHLRAVAAVLASRGVAYRIIT